MSDLDDAVLFRRTCRGDQQAARMLYERYAQRLYRFLLAYVGDDASAEDLVQEVFLRLWKHCYRYSEQGNFKAYLYRIARNVATDHHRRRETAAKGLGRQQQQQEEVRWTRDEDWIEIEALYQALSRLRGPYRDVLVLRFLEGLSPDEVAEILGKSAGAVRVLQHRALKALRQILDSMDAV